MAMNTETFLPTTLKIFKQYKALGDKTFEQLSESDISWKANEASNSVAIIVHHLSGNMLSRFTDFLTSDGEKPWRKRDDEFDYGYPSKAEMLEAWEDGWRVVFNALENLQDRQLNDKVYIRGEQHTVMEAILRQLAHYSSHIGQIQYIGKEIRGNDWKSLSIPKGRSQEFNQEKFGKK
jgi:hypothetical protein